MSELISYSLIVVSGLLVGFTSQSKKQLIAGLIILNASLTAGVLL